MSFLAGDGVCVRCRETVQLGGQPLKWRVGLPHRIYLQALATHMALPLVAHPRPFSKRQSVQHNHLLKTEKQSCALLRYCSSCTVSHDCVRVPAGYGLPRFTQQGAVRGGLQPR